MIPVYTKNIAKYTAVTIHNPALIFANTVLFLRYSLEKKTASDFQANSFEKTPDTR